MPSTVRNCALWVTEFISFNHLLPRLMRENLDLDRRTSKTQRKKHRQLITSALAPKPVYTLFPLSTTQGYHSVIYSFFFFSFYSHTCRIWKFPGYGSDQSYSCRPTPQPQQHQIWATSVTYATACGNTRSLTHWVRSWVKLASSCIVVGYLTHWTTVGMPRVHIFNHYASGFRSKFFTCLQ